MSFLSIFDLGEPKGTYPAPPTVDGRFVHPRDRDVVDIIWQVSSGRSPPFIAGGACLAWYQGRATASDIDVYFTSREHFDIFNTQWSTTMGQKYYKTITSESNNAITYRLQNIDDGRQHTVQLILKKFYKDLEEVLDDFDITVCKIGYDHRRVIIRSTFVEDVAHKTLRFDSINPQSHKRLVKYMSYGFEPSAETIRQICHSSNIDWTITGTDHYA
jgi:hypothetical protein